MDRISSTNVFVSALQKELTSLRDKNCILCQDLEVMKAENSKFRKDFTDNVANVTALREDHSSLKAVVTSTEREVATLQRAVKDNVTAVREDRSSLKTVVTSTAREVATLQRAVKDNDTGAGVPEAKMGEKDTCTKGRVNVSPLPSPTYRPPAPPPPPPPHPPPHLPRPPCFEPTQ